MLFAFSPRILTRRANGTVILACATDTYAFVVKTANTDGITPAHELARVAVRAEIERERKLVESMSHVHVITVLHIDAIPCDVYCMPMFTHTIGSVFKMDVPTDTRIRILQELISAIRYVASIGMVHGDIKSDNIFVNVVNSLTTPEIGPVTLADFGFCKQSQNVMLKDIMKMPAWVVQHGTAFQSADAVIYLTDMIQFVKNIFLPLLNLHHVVECHSDIHLCVDRVYMQLDAYSPLMLNYALAMSDFTLISEVVMQAPFVGRCLNPFRRPVDIMAFVRNVKRTRVRGTSKYANYPILLEVLSQLVLFPRYNSIPAVLAAWDTLSRKCGATRKWRAD